MAVVSGCGRNDKVVGDVASQLHIPHLSLEVGAEGGGGGGGFSLYLAPSREDMGRAVTDMLGRMGTRKVALVAHKESGTVVASRTHFELMDPLSCL